MTEQERQANRDLRALDEAHRLGRISRDEYRARRRRVLDALCDSGGVTARKAIAPPAPVAGRRPDASPGGSNDALHVLFPARSGTGKYVIALVAVAVVCALALYVLL